MTTVKRTQQYASHSQPQVSKPKNPARVSRTADPLEKFHRAEEEIRILPGLAAKPLNPLTLLQKSVQEWNRWRQENSDTRPELVGARLSGMNLQRVDLREANLSKANLSKADLSAANLSMADLSNADLSGADLRRANL